MSSDSVNQVIFSVKDVDETTLKKATVERRQNKKDLDSFDISNERYYYKNHKKGHFSYLTTVDDPDLAQRTDAQIHENNQNVTLRACTQEGYDNLKKKFESNQASGNYQRIKELIENFRNNYPYFPTESPLYQEILRIEQEIQVNESFNSQQMPPIDIKIKNELENNFGGGFEGQ